MALQTTLAIDVPILDWGLAVPFTPQDKPPLAIAMIVTINGTRAVETISVGSGIQRQATASP